MNFTRISSYDTGNLMGATMRMRQNNMKYHDSFQIKARKKRVVYHHFSLLGCIVYLYRKYGKYPLLNQLKKKESLSCFIFVPCIQSFGYLFPIKIGISNLTIWR